MLAHESAGILLGKRPRASTPPGEHPPPDLEINLRPPKTYPTWAANSAICADCTLDRAALGDMVFEDSYLERRLGKRAYHVWRVMCVCRRKDGLTHITHRGVAHKKGFSPLSIPSVKKAMVTLRDAGLIHDLGQEWKWKNDHAIRVYWRQVFGGWVVVTGIPERIVMVPNRTALWMLRKGYEELRGGRRIGAGRPVGKACPQVSEDTMESIRADGGIIKKGGATNQKGYRDTYILKQSKRVPRESGSDNQKGYREKSKRVPREIKKGTAYNTNILVSEVIDQGFSLREKRSAAAEPFCFALTSTPTPQLAKPTSPGDPGALADPIKCVTSPGYSGVAVAANPTVAAPDSGLDPALAPDSSATFNPVIDVSDPNTGEVGVGNADAVMDGYRFGVDGVPEYPDDKVLMCYRIPAPPLLPPGLSDIDAAIWLVRAYRGAVNHRYKKRCMVLIKRSQVENYKGLGTLVEAARTMERGNISPGSWAAFSVDVWRGMAKSGGRSPDKSFPPLGMVYGKKWIEDHTGWFRGEEINYAMPRARQTPAGMGLLRRFALMQCDLMTRTRRGESVMAVVDRFFPDGLYDRLLDMAREYAAAAQYNINRRLARGEWLGW